MATKPKRYDGSDSQFLAACDRAKVIPTHRQWRKWMNKRGSAYKAR